MQALRRCPLASGYRKGRAEIGPAVWEASPEGGGCLGMRARGMGNEWHHARRLHDYADGTAGASQC